MQAGWTNNVLGQQFGRSLLPLVILLEAAADMLAEIKNRRISDLIKYAHALFATCEDPSIGQNLQLSGSVGLGGACRLHQIADIPFSGFERNDQFESEWFTERPEASRDERKDLVRQSVSGN